MTQNEGTYGEGYFDWQIQGAFRSARNIVPEVLALTQPESVLDVGCGSGAWLAAFRERGIEDILGVDGDYIHKERLPIPADKFLAHNLEEPLDLHRQFDLVVSLEVAEHISEDSADIYVDSVTRHGSLVLFSAATPHQGGQHHVNEQWPDYWAEKFQNRGYAVLDPIRPRIWSNPEVEWWYAQNVVMFATIDRILHSQSLRTALGQTNPNLLNLVHPGNYLAAVAASPAEIYRRTRYSE